MTLLDPGVVTVGHVRFIGATLWTDFLLEGVAGEAWAHLEVGAGLSDFTGAIRHHAGRDGLFTTRECARRHAEHRAFIERELEGAERSGLTPVVITHHVPSPRSIRPWFAKSRLNPRFASDLDAVIARYQPPIWIHGHMHDRVDEKLGETRVTCNPGGYSPLRAMSSTRRSSSKSDARMGMDADVPTTTDENRGGRVRTAAPTVAYCAGSLP